jgi:hypothetical protein
MSATRTTEAVSLITERPLLTAEECRKVRDDVHALNKFWQPLKRDLRITHYSLGTPSYIGGENPAIYAAQARLLNPLLQARFAWLYGRLAEGLSSELGEPTAYRPTFSLPGFHIYVRRSGLTAEGGCIHHDGQYRLLDWAPDAEFDRPISYTLPVTLPRTGGGLNYWDLFRSEIKTGVKREDLEPILRTREQRHHRYGVGRLVVQWGEFFHQIAGTVDPQDDDERITLQGHAVRCGSEWILYW